MKVLVIGGTGFLGRNIVAQLIDLNKDVTVLTRDQKKMNFFPQKVSFITGDLLDAANIDLNCFEQIINCSGEVNDISLMRKIHIEAPLILLEKVKKTPGIHWLQISSVGVYGQKKQGTIVEDTPFSPVGEYELTKAEGESCIKSYCILNKINYTIIRPSNVFGLGMGNKSLHQLIATIKRNLFFYIGKNIDNFVMNYVCVIDVANFICICLDDDASFNHDFIISDQISLPNFIRIVSETLGSKSSFPSLPEKTIRLLAKIMQFSHSFPLTESRIDALTSQVIYSTLKAKERLGFDFSVGISSGLKDFCEKSFMEDNYKAV